MHDHKYKLEPIDFIIFQLFTISQSEKIQKRIQKNKIIVPVIYTIFAIVFFVLSNILLGSLFILLSILWYFFYPSFQKARYKKYYTKYINANFVSQFESSSNILIDKEFAYITNKDDEIKVNLNEIIEVSEIKTHIYLKFNSGNTLIIPKEKIEDFNKFYQHIENIIKAKSIEIKIDHDWKV